MLELHEGIPRVYSSVLIQMQTGKIALAGYLGTFSAMETTACPCGGAVQTIQHVLTACDRHADLQSSVLWGDRRITDYQQLLGVSSEPGLARRASEFMI